LKRIIKMDVKRQQDLQNKPKILPLSNGPYYLINDMNPRIVEHLQDENGKSLSNISGVALCRCGASKNKPFCDGTHSVIGFSSSNGVISDDGKISKDKKKSYAGRNIVIHDNRRICSHAAECVDNLSTVFKLDARPWIDPDGANVEDIIQTIGKCPSGALSYSTDGVEYKDQTERDPMITVSKNGPYHVTGGIDLIGDSIQWADGSSKEHYALCRCGASSNKPFCDGMHKSINFED
jgi:CDGSH-type Zn-finger protein